MAGQSAITSTIYEAFLHCETKAYLLLEGSTGLSSDVQDWEAALAHDFQRSASNRLQFTLRDGEYSFETPSLESLREGTHRVFFDPLISTPGIAAQLHVLQRLPPSHHAPTPTYAPIRFVRSEKLRSFDKLLLAFDALAISRLTGNSPRAGKIIHGSAFTVVTTALPKLLEKAKLVLDRIAARRALATAPPLVLNRHCPACEFQLRCRQLAIEKDDLSLLSNMSDAERRRLNARGLFTVTQLSHTYRPRRHLVRNGARSPKHDSALKALAIRKGRIHVVGSPTFTIPSAAVYFDVEGVPERDFYYLIGLRRKIGDRYTNQYFWADTAADEHDMWASFLGALSAIETPRLIHYGSYETKFLKRMKTRYCSGNTEGAVVDKLLAGSINLLSFTYSQINFPTYSNSLKDIARYIGFQWSDPSASGLSCLLWRANWEASGSSDYKQRLVTYNAEDCEAVQKLADIIAIVCAEQPSISPKSVSVNINGLERDYPRRFGKLRYVLPEFKTINEAAYWDYQRSKVYARSKKRIEPSACSPRSRSYSKKSVRINKNILTTENRPDFCPKCNCTRMYKNGHFSSIVYDLRFSGAGIKRWVTKSFFTSYTCWICKSRYNELPRQERYGRDLRSYILYQIIELGMSQLSVGRNLHTLFNLQISRSAMARIKTSSAKGYEVTYRSILSRIVGGNLVHVDETTVKFGGGTGYVWVFTNLVDVAYVFSETRGASVPKDILGNFKGVLVTDFYTGYDSVECQQQKCLIHLMRDMNEDVLKNAFNEEMEELAHSFAGIIKPMIETIDRFGLKSRYLRKHKKAVKRFYRALAKHEYQTEVSIGYKKRFEKNRDKLFTFLDHDGIPWNNNNAEHAVKAFAELRGGIGPNGTPKSIQEYLMLMSICESCKYRRVGFLSFLRSGELDIDAFASRW